VSRRWSPKRGAAVDIFDDLVHFTRAFPHKRLTLEVPLVEVEELRYPGHGRRRRWPDRCPGEAGHDGENTKHNQHLDPGEPVIVSDM